MSIYTEKRAELVLHRANADLRREQARHTNMQGHTALANAFRRAAMAETAMASVIEANMVDGAYGPSPEDIAAGGISAAKVYVVAEKCHESPIVVIITNACIFCASAASAMFVEDHL